MPIKFQDLKPSPQLRSELDDAYERVMSSGRYVGGYDYDLPEADRLAAQVLSLPVAPHLTDDDIDSVIEAITECAS